MKTFWLGRRCWAMLWLLSLLGLASSACAAGGFGFLGAWGVAGKAPGALNGPDNIAVDLRGNVYVADRDNNRIEKFSSSGAFLAALGRNGGDGSAGAGNGELSQPRGVATDGFGNLYVADSRNNRIEKFGAAGAFLARFGRNGGDGSAGLGAGEFNDPRGLATDAAGNLYVADHGNNRVQKLDPLGRPLARWGRNGGDGSAGAGNGEFNNPRGIAVDRLGNVYVADKNNNRIQKLNSNGQFVAKWGRNGGDGTSGTGNGEFNVPYSVALDRSGNAYVADRGNNRVQKLTPDGRFLARIGRNGGDGSAGSGPGEFRGPYGVATDCRGNLYVTDEGNNRVEKFGDPTALAPICPPVLSVGKVPQRIQSRRLALTVSCDEPCTITVRGAVARRGRLIARFRNASISVLPTAPGVTRLRLTGEAWRIVRRALAAGNPLVAVIDATATGFAGHAQPINRQRRLRH